MNKLVFVFKLFRKPFIGVFALWHRHFVDQEGLKQHLLATLELLQLFFVPDEHLFRN